MDHGSRRFRRYNAEMSRRHIFVFTVPFFLLGIPAYAYGDPTGGTFLQVLLPMLAAVWAMFLIFANRIRRAVTGLLKKMRGVKSDDRLSQKSREESEPLSS
jgi:hypothetical protein